MARKRALISVFRKEGIVDLARGLDSRGYEIVSSGGTASELTKAKVPVVSVSTATGFPEILDGRVKTLHPLIHGGILARRDRPEQLDRPGGIDGPTRLFLAQKAFRHTARYEAAIAGYFAQVEVREGGYAVAESEDVFPYRLTLNYEKVQDLRYGENPHQRAAFYSDLGSTLYSVAAARKVQGKELSFNNILDLDAAWRLVTELPDAAC